MPTRAESFAGLSVAIVTPFRNDEVDYPALKAQIEFQIAAGTHRPAAVRVQHSRPHWKKYRAGNFHPPSRAEKHHDGQRSHRLARSGFADHRLNRSHRAQW